MKCKEVGTPDGDFSVMTSQPPVYGICTYGVEQCLLRSEVEMMKRVRMIMKKKKNK